jgi:hypothetical protein
LRAIAGPASIARKDDFAGIARRDSGYGTNPSSRALRSASVRRRASSFSSNLATWVFTVFGET